MKKIILILVFAIASSACATSYIHKRTTVCGRSASLASAGGTCLRVYFEYGNSQYSGLLLDNFNGRISVVIDNCNDPILRTVIIKRSQVISTEEVSCSGQ